MAILYRMIVEKERRHCQHGIHMYCSQVSRRKKLLSVIQYGLVGMQALCNPSNDSLNTTLKLMYVCLKSR